MCVPPVLGGAVAGYRSTGGARAEWVCGRDRAGKETRPPAAVADAAATAAGGPALRPAPRSSSLHRGNDALQGSARQLLDVGCGILGVGHCAQLDHVELHDDVADSHEDKD